MAQRARRAPKKRLYTVVELEAQNLWTRLDEKLAAIGGCANVPP